MGMGIPQAVQTMGGLYFWKKDRDVPDQWHVLFEYPKQDLNVTFACTFHNRHEGTKTLILGRDASIDVASNYCRVYDAEWKSKATEPVYEWKKGEMEVTSHQRNWIDSIRGQDKPRCGMDRAWEEAVTIVMSVESFFKERKVKWDPVNEVVM